MSWQGLKKTKKEKHEKLLGTIHAIKEEEREDKKILGTISIKKEEPVYEKLSPGDIFIFSKDENGCLFVARNENGKIKIEKVCPIKT